MRALRKAPVLLIVLGLVTACRRPAAEELLPKTGEAPGWSMKDSPRTYTADRLWEYIDGDAERYLNAGFDSVVTAGYLHESGLEAKADIFLMKTPEAARRIYSEEPAEGSTMLGLGEEGRAWENSLIFRSGRYVVRVLGYGSGPAVGSSLRELAAVIAARLPRAS